MNECKTIGEHKYSVPKLNATEQMMMKARLLKYSGAAIGTVFSGMGKSKAKQIEVLSEGISKMFGKYPEIEVINFIKEVACHAIRDGERMQVSSFDEYFAEDLFDAYILFAFVLEVQFKGFIKRVLKGQ